jgi:hypothetical protein
MEAQNILKQIRDEYEGLEYPKYRHVQIPDLQEKLKILQDLKYFLKDDPSYVNLLNSIAQTLYRIATKTKWMNTSERSINKAIPPLVRRKNREIEFPFRWVEEKHGQECFINNGYWSAKNYMVMDVVGYFFLLSVGGDILPTKADPIFKDLASIKKREMELNSTALSLPPSTQPGEVDKANILNAPGKLSVSFTDKEFRKFVGQDLSSNEILQLLLDTSRVEFKLVFPVRLCLDKKGTKEDFYIMHFFSHPFEVGYANIDVREDGVVRQRRYTVVFNTILGELFVHNLLAKNYDWVDSGFYKLPQSAQVFYRRFLLHNNYALVPINLETIAQKLNYSDRNITNLPRTVEENVLKPLIDFGLLSSYEKESGLGGIKFIIKREKQIEQEGSNEFTTIESGVCKT